jgi:hypothetical protein
MITVTDSWAGRQTSPLLPQRERGPRTQPLPLQTGGFLGTTMGPLQFSPANQPFLAGQEWGP